MDCTHREPDKWIWEEVIDEWSGDTIVVKNRYYGRSLDVDLDIGRFQCTACGRIGYYTGQWREYHEKGVPCFGSDHVHREVEK